MMGCGNVVMRHYKGPILLLKKFGAWLGEAEIKQKKSRTKTPSIHEEDLSKSPSRGWDDFLPQGYWELTL